MIMHSLIIRLIGFIAVLSLISNAQAGSPLWSFTPLTVTTLSVTSSGTAIVQYQVTNHSRKSHTLVMRSISGITQLTGPGVCGNPFLLNGNASCTLSLQINGSEIYRAISDGPIICDQSSALQCYRPSAADLLHITLVPSVSGATISVSGSPLMLTTIGPSGILVINNTSSQVTATNISSNFAGTALDGNVTETANTCSSVPPMGSCTLTYTPGSTVVPLTDFPIQGSNTNAVTASIQIDTNISLLSVSPSSGATSGGTGVTLTGTGLSGATSVTFGGIAATSVNVVNSTTVTAVTPAHAAGAVDVVITTPGGSATDVNGYTYLTTAVGQPAFGGTIACLNGGSNNLIAATADNSTGIQWGGFGTTTSATSITDGAANTQAIVTILAGNGGVPYAAQLCHNYEVDSQGSTPCQSGNTCYNDWYLPAGNNPALSGQINCLYTNKVAIGGFTNAEYWSSTEQGSNSAWLEDFNVGVDDFNVKGANRRVRCVRSFTP